MPKVHSWFLGALAALGGLGTAAADPIASPGAPPRDGDVFVIESQQPGGAWGEPRNAAVRERYRQTLADEQVPLSVLDRDVISYDDARNRARNQDRAWPLLPEGAPCPGGGAWPKCRFEKDDVAHSLHRHIKLGESQAGGVWGYELINTGPGDAFGLVITQETWGPTPAGADEGSTTFDVRVRDVPGPLPKGTLATALTPGSTSFDTALWAPDVVYYMGESSLIVFPEAKGASALDGDDGAGAGVGGLEDYDNARNTWIVNVAAEIPAAVRQDPAVGHTRWCLGVEKSRRRTNWGGDTYLAWILVRSGPGDKGCGGKCGERELEGYVPYLGGWRGSHQNLVPGVVWTDFARDASDDDAVLAPCEVHDYTEFGVDPQSGKPIPTTGTSRWRIRLRNAFTRSLPVGSRWEMVPMGYAAQFKPRKLLVEYSHIENEPVDSITAACFKADPRECGRAATGSYFHAGRARPAKTNGPTDSGVLASRGYEVDGVVDRAAHSYVPGRGEAELSPALNVAVDWDDWGKDVADRVPMECLGRGNSVSYGNAEACRLYDTADGRWLVSRGAAITQQVEIGTVHPITLHLLPGLDASCNDVCASAGGLVCSGVVEAGVWNGDGDCAESSRSSGASLGHYCDCRSGER
jgi:hypothetical protein